MKNYTIKFPAISDNHDFSLLATELGGLIHANADDVIELSGNIARGTVKRVQLYPDFRMCAWDMVFYSPADLCKEVNAAQLNNSYNIIYILTPESVAVKNIGLHPQYNKLQSKSALLLPDDVYIEWELQPNQPIRLLYFNIAASWFREQLQPIPALLHELNSEDEENTPLIIIEPCLTNENQAACRLFNTILQHEDEFTSLQTPAYLLITEFLEKIANKKNTKVAPHRNIYYSKVAEAEEILRAHLQTNLPTLDVIAKRVALSESTLKRHFKAVYGKNIYEYYLEQKMILAKSMLLERPITVNETAEILGYEKVSNFIDIFKKHHGFSPGRMKRMELIKLQ